MEEKTPTKGQYRTANLTAIPIGQNNVLVRTSKQKTTQLLTHSEAAQLLSCQTFDTLQTHAERYCRQHKNAISLGGEGLPPQDKKIKPLLLKLQKWAEEGLLVSESDLRDDIRTFSQKNKQIKLESNEITAVGIPTCGRPETLNRCLMSFVDNFNKHDRVPDIYIIDDSRAKKDQKKNQAILEALQNHYNGAFYYMNRSQRRAFAQAIARKANIDPELMNFAFMGHPSCNRSEGGCRNAFLLLTRDKTALQTDDDTICNIARPPIFSSRLKLTSELTSDEYWFFRSYEEAVKAVDFIDKDFLSIHEEVLGKPVGNVTTPVLNKRIGPDITKLSTSFLQNDMQKKARVLVSMVGPVGDSCLYTDLYRLFLNGESLQRLLYPPEHYSWHLSTRQVIRSVVQTTISNFIRCIGMNFAIDNRNLLPPFMPVQARCDGIFGDILTACFPHAFAGNLPYMLAHNPPEQRSRSPEKLFSLLKSNRVNDIIADIIYSSQNWPYVKNPEENMQFLGQFLLNLAKRSQTDFENKVYQIAASRTSGRIQMAEQKLAQKINGPSYWSNHMQQYISALNESLLNTNFGVPTDIDNPSNDKEDFKDIVLHLGKLLSEWPNIYQVMGDFSQDEMHNYLTRI